MTDPFAQFPEIDSPTPALPAVRPVSALDMPDEFAFSTVLALRAQQEILAMALDESDPHFEGKLRAKAQVSSQQINAQLKADEQRLKGQIAKISYYAELKKALEAFGEK